MTPALRPKDPSITPTHTSLAYDLLQVDRMAISSDVKKRCLNDSSLNVLFPEDPVIPEALDEVFFEDFLASAQLTQTSFAALDLSCCSG